MMITRFAALLCVLLGTASGGDLVLSPALTDNALAVTLNPAGLCTYRNPNLALHSGFSPDSLFHAAFSIKGFGIGARSDGVNRSFYIANGARIKGGLGFGMRTGYVDTPGEDYYNYDIGLLYRPVSFLSLGACTDNFVHGGVDEKTVIRLGAGLKPLSFVVVNYDVDYDGDFLRPHVGAEILMDGFNIAGSADLRSQSFSAGVTMSVPHLEGGVLYPLEKKDRDRRFSLWMGMDRKPSAIPLPRRTAVIEINGEFTDIYPEFSLFGSAFSQPLGKVLTQLRNAANDGDIRCVILKIGNVQSGLGVIDEIRNAVMDLRISGKRVICYLDNVEFLEYYLACSGDQIVVEPAGAWIVAGVRAEIMFLKGTLDKLGIKAEFARVGEYKSAVEPLTRDSISPEFRENEEQLLKSVYDYLVDGIASARDLEREKVVAAIDSGTLSLKDAVKKGFIDRTGYFNDLIAEYSPSREKSVSLDKRTYYNTAWQKKKRIAVVMATGTIVSGESFTDFISGEVFMGSETVARTLKQVRLDRGVKAVVFRINSGGGSGVASDVIWHEIEELRKAGKPVIASIGDVAASGGYYIACNADTILCNQGSIVGSIGVFTGKFVLKGLYDKIGVKKEIIKFGANADAFTDYREFTPEQRARLQGSLDEFYDGFITKVSDGRRFSKAKADSLGRGRVFTGAQARENGLVDMIGDLAEAIDIAKARAGFSEGETPDIEVFPKRKTFFSNVMDDEEEGGAKASRSFLRVLETLSSYQVLAIMPYRISIE